MGVTGLWRLIEPAGKPVPVETLENKVLAVDISIWLHQMVKGYQDAKGAPLPNAHLMGLFQRLCKLLYFRVKPVFVFDGAFPELKKETIAKRQDHKAKYNSQSEKLKREIALLLGKKTAISALLGKQISPKKNKQQIQDSDDLFKLPALPEKETESESESDDEQNSSASTVDLHSVDLDSEKFKTMPLKDKYDLLVELKETRKMNSWGKINTLPKKSDNFSDFQMQRLLKRRKLQECLEETEKEMGDSGMSLTELESLLNEEGIDTKIDSLPGKRIASNNTTRYLFITNVKQALEEAKRKEIAAAKVNEQPGTSTDQEKRCSDQDELEDDLQKAIKMSLECVDDADTSACASKTDDSWTSVLTDTDYSDDEDDDRFQQPDMMSAKAYIMQYSDFTHKAIDSIVTTKRKNKNKTKEPKIDEIIEELNQEKTIIEDNIELSSSDEENIQKCVDSKDSSEKNQSIVDEKNVANKTENNEFIKHNEKDTFNINDTQQSVICIENSSDEIISIETSMEESEDQCTKLEQPKPTVDLESESCDSLLKQPEPKAYLESRSSDLQLVQPKPKVELTPESSNYLLEQPKLKVDQESESSDDDFEDVSDNEEKPQKASIQLTLKMGEEVEDDIFADIFENDVNKAVDKNSNIHDNNPIKTELLQPDVTESKYKDLENKLSKTQKIELNQNPVDKSQNKVTVVNHDISSKYKIDTVSENCNDNLKNKNPYNELSSGMTAKKNGSEVVEKSLNSEAMTVKELNTLPSKITSKENVTEVVENPPNREVMTVEKLNTLASELENEEEDLLQEKGRLDRIGRNITEQMTKEAQELLRVFGIPYIVAPMEAEAQCAFLENAKLTDGTITDDSDIWLFGGKTVYKNFFNQKKHVLQFLSERIEKSFNLSREQLILLALLVGSDYTTGVSGVGPVTALEILASFPFNKKKLSSDQPKQTLYQELIAGLLEFKKWVRAGKRTDNISLKKKLKNVNLTDDFPSVRVVQAYLEPNVERSEEKFSWGEVDITILRDYTKSKFGWSQNKLDEIIKPVLKRMLDRKNQKTVYDYFKRKLEFQSLEDQMSKRVKAAVRKMGPEESVKNVNDELDIINNDKLKPKRKRKAKTNNADEAGPSKSKQLKSTENEDEIKDIDEIVKSTVVRDSEKIVDVSVKKSDRYQEIIPQREMDKKNLLENKLKAIELFRKTKIDRKTKKTKRKLPVPKEKANLSESDSD